MKYDLTARLFPLLFDKYAYRCLKKHGISNEIRKASHQEYKAMVLRTPSLQKNSPFTGNLLMGCYVLSFYKAAPEQITEDIFHNLIISLCTSRPMVRGHEKEDALDSKILSQKEIDAVASKDSPYETDWEFTITCNQERDAYDLIYTRCGLCRLGIRENCFHLIRYLCEADYITYDLMNAKLTRSHTLAKGDAYCDFHVERKNSEC